MRGYNAWLQCYNVIMRGYTWAWCTDRGQVAQALHGDAVPANTMWRKLLYSGFTNLQ